ncbi:hypothetical protein DAPPUDRAFT_248788 [Daphnia pulex]|uniref:Uncharacterized protein n=1 Tax=Daphnia pulex TaxID=6669 RepID=E9GV80_DAPPU|nr:hypothetical protein DAPPUDRAFT_248788 [Daphnia pulex]|eukprot:EFX76617.1 hypothetical protein DAPPUDRAFT_248788 [Daphnia pulex]
MFDNTVQLVPNMASESSTFDRLDKILELELTGEPLLPKTPHLYVQSSASGKNASDHGNEEQWDVEYSSNFAELVMHFIIVFKTISPMLLIQHSNTLKSFYSEFIRLWFPTRTTSVLHAAVQDPFNVETVKLILERGADPNAIDQNGRTPRLVIALLKFP